MPAPSGLSELFSAKIAERRREVEEQASRLFELERCRDRFAYFLFEYVRTVDEHDPTDPAKPIPRLEYIKDIADIMQFERRIAIEKSRQMMCSWILVAHALWAAMFRPNVLWFLQSKKEADAADRLYRIYQIYYRLPEWLQERFPINLASGRPGVTLHAEMHFTWRSKDADFFGVEREKLDGLIKAKAVRSKIWAVPQGGDIVRQYVASGISSDESAFQTEASEAFTAAAPMLGQDSWYVHVSTANGGSFFEKICRDRELG